ncbi:glycerophosphodiester phosphodiesterase [Arenicella chitinivorans]
MPTFICALLVVLLVPVIHAKPEVIAHRGASGYLPEHTLEAATLAFAQGADYVEQDLVLTRDLVPVVLHDIHLDTVTNVAMLFPDRRRDDGRYYAFDFTLAELKTLTVHERRQLDGTQVFKDRYQGEAEFKIATFEEQLELIAQLNRQFDKQVGYYPEIKSPAWHRVQGADISKIVLNILRQHGLDDASKKIYVQCFDFAETQRLRTELNAKVKLIQLIGENTWGESSTDYTVLQTDDGLKRIAQVAEGIGPWIPHLIDPGSGKPTGLVARAHAAGLAVHAYTFRVDALPDGVKVEDLLSTLFDELKIDGLFTDFTDVVQNFAR